MIGSGVRRSKLLVLGALAAELPGAEVVEGWPVSDQTQDTGTEGRNETGGAGPQVERPAPELRVMQTGGAALTAGFLLTLPFQSSFADPTTRARPPPGPDFLLAALTTAS